MTPRLKFPPATAVRLIVFGLVLFLGTLAFAQAYGQPGQPSALQVELWRRTTTLWETEQELRRQTAILTEVLRIVEVRGDSTLKAEVGRVAWLEKP